MTQSNHLTINCPNCNQQVAIPVKDLSMPQMKEAILNRLGHPKETNHGSFTKQEMKMLYDYIMKSSVGGV